MFGTTGWSATKFQVTLKDRLDLSFKALGPNARLSHREHPGSPPLSK